MYDTIVVGLGGAGASTAYHAARSGGKVLGLEQFGVVHENGSSHGKSRIYRTAYFEGAAYVPLVQRAQQLWNELQRESRAPILRKTGGLMLGTPDRPTVSGAIRTATSCSLEHEVLTASDVQRRFPAFVPRPSEIAVWDPDAGVLYPENCIRAHADGAMRAGAELHYGERVRSWSAKGDSVTVRTELGEYASRSVVLTAGAWTPSLAEELALPLVIERQFVLWFPAKDPALVAPERMPVFLWDRGAHEHTYGVPDLGDGVKVGSWIVKTATTPETADRTFGEEAAAPVRHFVETSLRGVTDRETAHASCLYTNAPDGHFLIGTHPRHRHVVIVSACSGHGFKFTSVVGEIAQRLAAGDDPGFDLSMFRPTRFGSRPERPD
jgi:sarcosine oxidase